MPLNQKELGFFLNHNCNKNCGLCSIRLSESDYLGMTKDDYKYVMSKIGDTSDIKIVVLVGGEPFIHPDYLWFVENTLKDFPQAIVKTKTNGKLLPKYIDLLSPRMIIQVSEYPGWNDEVVAKYKGTSPHLIFLQDIGFMNVYLDAKLNEVEAKEAFNNCTQERRIVGRNLYGCCAAEVMERCYDLTDIHVPFDASWRGDAGRLETWKACQHCFRNAKDNIRIKGRWAWNHTTQRDDLPL